MTENIVVLPVYGMGESNAALTISPLRYAALFRFFRLTKLKRFQFKRECEVH